MGNALRFAGATAVAAVAIVAAGCGSNGSPSASSATTTTTATAPGTGGGANTADRTAFNACLAQHGVTLPARPPGGGGGGGNGQPPAGGPGGGGFANLTAAQRAAFTACRSKLPAGGFGGGRPGGGNRANNPAFAKYNTCLKQHGVTLGASNSPTAFAKAQAACAKLAPTARPAGAGGSGGGATLQ
ncbi:MAG: hypothetical protein JWO17_763 [Actinomycetia bacterium]|nr:hypothetical protein [Actinomycetes bacterium]